MSLRGAGRRGSPALAGLLALAASACQSAVAPEPSRLPPAQTDCENGLVRLTQDFAGAGGSQCTRLGPARFELRIEPEARPINPSPWYAFDLRREAGAPQRDAEIVLEYAVARHRYAARARTAAGWSLLDAEAVTVLDDEGRRASLSVALPPPGRSVRIAAQEVVPAAERRAWRQDFAGRTGFELFEIGRSVEGRPIDALMRSSARLDAPLVIILGGQHPPEVPGVLGHRAFLNALADYEQRRDDILDAAHWLVIPALNPDGVDGGHWRLNAGLVDLNRDWGPFTQPETTAAHRAIEAALEEAGPPLILLDFHATWRDVLYTPEGTSLGLTHPLAQRLVDEIEAALPAGEASFEVAPGHNPGQPTAKTWFYETYGAPGVTVEFGDGTNRNRIRSLAEALAEALSKVVAECCADMSHRSARSQWTALRSLHGPATTAEGQP